MDARLRGHDALLFAILLFAAGIRLWGIGWGLPYEYQSEEYKIVKYALRMGSGDLNPHFFEYPSLYLYYMLAVDGVYFLIGKLGGWFASPQDFGLHFVKDPTVFYLLGRINEAVCGILLIYLVYKAGKRLFSENTGLAAAAILAALPHYVYLSHIIKGYLGMTLLLLLCFWMCLEILEKGDKKSYILAGIFMGLAVSTRYHAAPFGIVIPAAHFLRREKNHRLFLLSLILIPIFFVLGTPYALITPGELWKDLGGNVAIYSSLTGHEQGLWFNLKFVASRFLLMGDVPAPKIVGGTLLAGFFLSLFRWRAAYLLLLAPLAAYVVVVTGYHSPAAGYLIPVFPLFILLGVHGILEGVPAGLKKTSAGLLIAAILWNGYEGACMAYSFTVPDTRTEAKEWIDKNIPAGSGVLIDFKVSSPPLLMSHEQLKRFRDKAALLNHYKKEYLELQLKAHPGEGNGYRLFNIKRSFRNIGSLEHQVEETQKIQDLLEVDGDISKIKKAGVQYVIVAEDVEKGAILQNIPGISDFYRSLPAHAVLVQRFDPHFRIAPSGVIAIYRL